MRSIRIIGKSCIMGIVQVNIDASDMKTIGWEVE